MKLGIDISQIVYQGTGVSRFTAGLTEAILNYDTENNWTFFFSSFRQKLDPELAKKIQSKRHSLIIWPVPPTLLSYLWNELHSPFVSPQFKSLDWFITSDWTEPQLPCKKATIVHDLVFMRYPETVDKKIATTQKKRLGLVTKESDVLFADSQSTADDLHQYFSVNKDKIRVIYPGVTVHEPSTVEIAQTKKDFNLNKPFILSVGKIEPRKNLQRLIEAYQQITTDVELVLVGPQGWDSLHTDNKRIHYLGFVNDKQLSSLYKSSLFFILPSIWEGFGYPAVEAMRLDCPVALSYTSSLKELGEGVACFFDPHNTNAIKVSLEQMISDEKLRNDIRTKGLEKSKQFSWQNYYTQFMQTLKEGTV